MSVFRFDEQQARVDELKKEATERMSDSAIQNIIDELREKGRTEGRLAFRPLVAMECDDGPIDKAVVIEAVTFSDLPQKQEVISALKKGRVKPFIKIGSLKFERTDT